MSFENSPIRPTKKKLLLQNGATYGTTVRCFGALNSRAMNFIPIYRISKSFNFKYIPSSHSITKFHFFDAMIPHGIVISFVKRPDIKTWSRSQAVPFQDLSYSWWIRWMKGPRENQYFKTYWMIQNTHIDRLHLFEDVIPCTIATTLVHVDINNIY